MLNLLLINKTKILITFCLYKSEFCFFTCLALHAKSHHKKIIDY